MSWAFNAQLVGSCTCWISCRFFRAVFQAFLEKPCAKVQSHNLPEGTTVVEAILALTDAKIEGTEQKRLSLEKCLKQSYRKYQDLSGPIRTYQDGSNLETMALILPLCEVRWSQSQSAPDRIRASTRWCCRQSALFVGALVFLAGSPEETELHIDQIRST